MSLICGACEVKREAKEAEDVFWVEVIQMEHICPLAIIIAVLLNSYFTWSKRLKNL